MTELIKNANTIIAFDVAKQKLDICCDPNLKAPALIKNTRPMISKFLQDMKKQASKQGFDPLFVIVEATGGYERRVLEACIELDIACHRAHPNKVHYFAKARGILAKTDKIDAATLQAFACSTPDLRPYQPLPACQVRLKALMMRRDDLVALKIAEKSRLATALEADVKKSLKSSLRHFTRQIMQIEEKIRFLVQQDAELSKKSELLKSFKGVGDWIAFAALAFMPELGSLSRNEAAALAGLAPYNDDSGKRSGRRRIRAGRKTFRDKLYMGAVSACTHNPKMREFSRRLVKNGKPEMLAITAVMRKMVVTFNAILKTQTPWKGAQNA